MNGLHKMMMQLQDQRHRFEELLAAAKGKSPPGQDGPTRLWEVTAFGSNPGNLRMRAYVPERLTSRPALVVALHGCTQTADEYDRGAGWSTLAERRGCIAVYPQQQPSNNPNNCFSWFLPADSRRDQGEALSIRQMVDHAIVNFGVDRRRVFVTGLSSGGAMASVMLAAYPDVFAAGAIVAGLPYGCATSVNEAFGVMFTEQSPSARALGDRVRSASKHRGPWPKISVWHGTADAIVKPANAENIIRQWIDVHRLRTHPSYEESVAGHTRRVWSDASGEAQIEAFAIKGMAHGVPITPGCGAPGPFFLDAGISSTQHIANFWHLEDAANTLEAAVPWGSRPAHMEADTGNTEFAAVFRQSDIKSAEWRCGAGATHAALRPLDPNRVIAAAFEAAGLPVPKLASRPSEATPRVVPDPIIEATLKAAGLIR